jgi:hypothetical protein
MRPAHVYANVSDEQYPLAWPVVEAFCDGLQILDGVGGQVAALGEVLAQQAIGVLVGAALPGLAGVGEEHALVELLGNVVVNGHL